MLIVKRAALGDVLRTTALLPAARRRWGGPVWWITAPAARPLLEGHPLVDRVLVSGESLKRRFDVALSLEEDADCARWAAGASEDVVGVTLRADGTLGYTLRSEPYYGMSLLRAEADGGKARADELKAANRKTFAELWHGILGLPLPKAAGPKLHLTEAERAAGARELANLRLGTARPLGLNAGAGGRWPSKQLSEEAAARLAKALRASGRPVVLLGGFEEVERNERIARACADPKIAAHRALPLRVFAGLVARCAAVVTTDTLTLHVAAGVGAPVAALVGPTSSAELDLGGRGALLTPPRGCGCFYAARCRRAVHCLDEIDAGAAARAALRLLA